MTQRQEEVDAEANTEVTNKLIIFSAPSGSGKTTVVRHLLNTIPDLEFSISATTRAKRPNETHGVDYYFYTKEAFLEAVEENKFIELQKTKWLYYSGKADIEVYKETPFDHRVMKTDLDKYMNADSELIKSKTKIDYYQLMIKFLESILKSIETRTFVIKNSLEFMKFTAGFS